MDIEALKAQWLREEDIAHIHGWDFSHIDARYEEPGERDSRYDATVKRYLSPDKSLLDIDTGGGEYLLSLKHPYDKTAATEAYPPNVKLCDQTLTPLGIRFREAGDYARMPFENGEFDIVINRHGDYKPAELYRMLKPGGVFVTEQVAEYNDWELVKLLIPGAKPNYVGWNLKNACADLERNGFVILERSETSFPIRFFDAGALVWFARIIEWEFAGFSVESCMDGLVRAQQIIERDGCVEGLARRFLLAARKPL